MPETDLYQSLRAVFARAVAQAADEKGQERHAIEGRPFEGQPMIEICRWLGSADFCLGQAIKKIQEANRLKGDAWTREILGAIDYLGGGVVAKEELEAQAANGTGQEPEPQPIDLPTCAECKHRHRCGVTGVCPGFVRCTEPEPEPAKGATCGECANVAGMSVKYCPRDWHWVNLDDRACVQFIRKPRTANGKGE